MKVLKDQKVNNMTKKEKILAVATLTYFILLVLCLLMLFICIPLQVKGVEIFVLIFMATLIVGYLVLALIKMLTFNYECPHCKATREINYFEVLFSRRGDNCRKLKCKECKNINYMERHAK
jgi:hypothetical protein